MATKRKTGLGLHQPTLFQMLPTSPAQVGVAEAVACLVRRLSVLMVYVAHRASV